MVVVAFVCLVTVGIEGGGAAHDDADSNCEAMEAMGKACSERDESTRKLDWLSCHFHSVQQQQQKQQAIKFPKAPSQGVGCQPQH